MDGIKLKHVYIPESTHNILKEAKKKKYNGADLPYVAMLLIEAGAKKICPECIKVGDNIQSTRKG